jgi:hypothetical protein
MENRPNNGWTDGLRRFRTDTMTERVALLTVGVGNWQQEECTDGSTRELRGMVSTVGESGSTRMKGPSGEQSNALDRLAACGRS